MKTKKLNIVIETYYDEKFGFFHAFMENPFKDGKCSAYKASHRTEKDAILNLFYSIAKYNEN